MCNVNIHLEAQFIISFPSSPHTRLSCPLNHQGEDEGRVPSSLIGIPTGHEAFTQINNNLTLHCDRGGSTRVYLFEKIVQQIFVHFNAYKLYIKNRNVNATATNKVEERSRMLE